MWDALTDAQRVVLVHAVVNEVVVTEETAERCRFLGSPSVRVDGSDVEIGADQRSSYHYGCRIYQTPAGMSGVPPEEYIRAALRATSADDQA